MRLSVFCLLAALANGLQKPHGAQSCNFARVFRNIETHTNVTLGAQMVDFIRLYRTNGLIQ